jgi:hypothetical protein
MIYGDWHPNPKGVSLVFYLDPAHDKKCFAASDNSTPFR